MSWTCQNRIKVLLLAITALFLYGFFHSILTSETFARAGFKQSSIRKLTGDHSNPQKNWQDQGLDYLTRTYELLPEYTGAKINCTHCHLQNGQRPYAAPWTGVTFRFPQYRARAGLEVDLADRINDCFERSLNGKALPKKHPAMKAILAYMDKLSPSRDDTGAGIRKLKLNRPPDLDNGKKIYGMKCAQCHQPNGQGLIVNGKTMFPPLWGKDSFNIAAGMARLHTAAGFVKHNMPQGNEGSLSDDEAWDVAAYFTQQDRPDFSRKNHDWPKGGKPEDARY